MMFNKETRIGRPRQIYVGNNETSYIDIEKRNWESKIKSFIKKK